MFVERIKQTVESVKQTIREDPGYANAIYRARVDLVEGVKCIATAQSSNPLQFDEPASPNLGLGCSINSGGKQLGMVPTELYLISVGSCLAIGCGMFAAMRDIELDQLTVELKGHLDMKGFLDMDDTVSPGFNRIEYELTVRSSAPEETLKQIVRLAVARSPIMVNVTEEVEMRGEVSINSRRFTPELAAV